MSGCLLLVPETEQAREGARLKDRLVLGSVDELISALAQAIPWTEEPGKLQSMGLESVRHDLVTFTSLTPRPFQEVLL